jgi:dTDP-L-rhamnose 4-epimerase
MSHILVTGGDGFIGSHVVDALIDGGHDVRVLDNLHPAAHAAAPATRNAGADYCYGDIADYVSHNDLGTAIFLRALARRTFAGRLVLASSMVVYGEGRYACAEHGLVRPGPRRRARLDGHRFEPPCPHCGEPLTPLSRTTPRADR